MGPDPFSMPSFGAQSAQQNNAALSQAVGQAAPLATQWHGPTQGVAIPQVFNTTSTPSSGGVLSKFAHFIGGVGSEVGHIAGGAASWLGKQTEAMVLAPYHYAQGISHAILDNYEINLVNAQTKQNSDLLNSLAANFRSGRITSDQYKAGLQGLIKSTNEVNQTQKSLDKRIAGDKADAYKATIDTASVLVTILTAGFGAGTAAIGEKGLTQVSGNALSFKSAANFLKSSALNLDLATTEGTINRLATSPETFEKLTPAAQKAIQSATAEIVAGNAGTMTSAQIARASAVNLALKYPVYFNMLSGQSQEIYSKLDDKKYGSAIQQMAINSALLLSGGPIGWALKKGGSLIKATVGATFGRSSFLDELSKGIGDGNPAGLYRAINNITDEATRKEAIQNLSAVEATNMAAIAGKDPVAGAWRVLNGMSSYEGIGMDQFTHEEALGNMITFAKAQRLVDEVGKANSLGPITVGRVDARALNKISAQLSPLASDDKDTIHNAWEALKSENPSQAWANNENFDRQMRNLINRHGNPAELDLAIRNIKASFEVKGFPEAEAKQLSKMGYIPIKPVSLEAPFKEGAGQLSTRFTQQSDDFFLKAVKPLPVLSSVGSLLTHMGLSPVNSTSRVYQMFNANLSQHITSMDFIKSFTDKGATDAETADTLIKRLSNYAHNPTSFAQKAAPIADLRQLTVGDIKRAIPELTKSQAHDVRDAIAQSMLEVPLTVRGLGDKIVDAGYSINPTQKGFMRIQQGARFAWNPFFQTKLAYKTEILAQAEAGGKFPTLLGTNKMLGVIFPDKYNQLDKIRGTLREVGIFDEKAQLGEAMSGEAVNDAGVAGANLTHKLLPSQERSIAGMVAVQADRLGLSVEDFVKYHENDVRDTVQMIAQYDRNSVFLNSAMARTLNLAFFPFRFEYKVASIMARSLARTSTMTQLAVVNGLYRAHDWLNSPEGQAWYSQNSDVIGLMEYLTPVQTLGEVSDLLGGKADSIGEFGELGGLPFGWIPQLLDAEGLTNFGGGYVSPKTGQALPDYVPDTDKGKLAAAIQDLVGSLYTYPGATAGLPSKTSIDRNIALGITGASKNKDFNKVTPEISQQQQNFAQAIQTSNPQQQPQQNKQIIGKPNPTIPGLMIPRLPSPIDNMPNKGPATTKTTTKKLKKSEFKPQLLPGQANLGQL